MKKNAFIKSLNQELSFLSRKEREEIIHYYDEMISDALEHGESEEEFVATLGSPEEIRGNIQKDGTFMDKVKNQFGHSFSQVFDTTVKVIGYFLFCIFAVVILSVSFSFVTSGLTMIAVSVYQLVVQPDVPTLQTIYQLSVILLGTGLGILGVGLFKWFFTTAKDMIQKVFKTVKSLLEK